MPSLPSSKNLEKIQGSSLWSESSFLSTSDSDGFNDCKRLDQECIQGIMKKVQLFEPLMNKSSRRRKIVCLLTSTAGTVLESGSWDSSQDSAGTSNAVNQASRYLDAMLQATDYRTTDQLGFTRYLKNLENLPKRLLEIEDSDYIRQLQCSKDIWNLIEVAAVASKEAYKDLRLVLRAAALESHHFSNFKPTFLSVQEFDDRRVLIVSVRGSASRRDWMVNFNSDMVSAPQILDGSLMCHRGFLAVAKAMESKLAAAILRALKNERSEKGAITEVIFTGHSAGGAVAQLFYAMSMTPGTKLSDVTGGGLDRIHCITFGSPPVSTTRFKRPSSPIFQSGQFLTIINEGDPVPLAQKRYMEALLDVYVLEKEQLDERYPRGFQVPQPVFKLSGDCIVLQTIDTDDVDSQDLRAIEVNADVIEGKLFGNSLAHLMKHYLQRIRSLSHPVTAATLEKGGSTLESDLEISHTEWKLV